MGNGGHPNRLILPPHGHAQWEEVPPLKEDQTSDQSQSLTAINNCSAQNQKRLEDCYLGLQNAFFLPKKPPFRNFTNVQNFKGKPFRPTKRRFVRRPRPLVKCEISPGKRIPVLRKPEVSNFDPIELCRL